MKVFTQKGSTWQYIGIIVSVIISSLLVMILFSTANFWYIEENVKQKLVTEYSLEVDGKFVFERNIFNFSKITYIQGQQTRVFSLNTNICCEFSTHEM